MISVVIPTRNAEHFLPTTLSALIPAAVDGVVREVIIADCGSCDQTRAVADAAGARIIEADQGRGPQLRAGAAAARFDWLLFLHADTVLDSNWQHEAAMWIEACQMRGTTSKAAVFKFALDDDGFGPRFLEWGVGMRSYIFAMPYGDQGLLISRAFYDELGGYKSIPLLEDVDMIRRIGRRRLKQFRTKATTSAIRYRTDGYFRRVLRNWYCIVLYYFGASPERLEKIYNG